MTTGKDTPVYSERTCYITIVPSTTRKFLKVHTTSRQNTVPAPDISLKYSRETLLNSYTLITCLVYLA